MGSDLAELVRLVGDWEVACWLASVPYPYTEQDGLDFIEKAEREFEQGHACTFAIAFRETNALMGAITLHLSNRPVAELGYWLGRPHWNCGYMSEAMAAMIDFAFGILGLPVLGARIMEGNTRSQRVLTRAGFIETGFEAGVCGLRGRTNIRVFALHGR